MAESCASIREEDIAMWRLRLRYGTAAAVAPLAALLLAGAAWGDPAALAPAALRGQIERSFAQFSRNWMQELQTRAARARTRPSVRPGADAPIVTYLGYAEDFRTELRATGRSTTPYVGLLHYTENLYSCSDARAAQCGVASSTPVTEVFRFRDGGWTY
jgi:hypothetical protein